MGTRSTIALKEKNEKITIIYCHFDGYLSGVGNILLEMYNDEIRIRKLMKKGTNGIISLKGDLKLIEKSNVESVSCVGLEEYFKTSIREGYNYLFDVEKNRGFTELHGSE